MRLPHFAVQRIVFKQFLVLALRFYPTVLHNNDIVRTGNGRQAMCDDNNGLILDKLRNGFLDNCFVFGVNLSRRFVENDDRRIL